MTDYSYIDTPAMGPGRQKKIIGQQVEKVFPQAVRKGIDIVPDIYQRTTMKDGSITLKTDLKKGERVRLIGERLQGVFEVLEVAEASFASVKKVN
ncbi:MAG TPA: hypothetical protein VHQ64_00690 [Pyrinomonadaceae bacterium]|nr:hypothetical protein [Pyrinomonadaceae bacterium]